MIASGNPCLERTSAVEGFAVGHEHRATRADVRGGGEGANVARALRAMGVEATLVAFVGGAVGEAMARLLEAEGIAVARVACAGETRICGVILSEGAITIVNDPPPAVDAETWLRFEREVGRRLGQGEIFVATGRLPPGAPADGVARLVAAAHGRGAVALCDASGAFLERALEAEPDLVSPNLHEARAVLEGASGPPPMDASQRLEEAADAAERLLRRGPRAALVSAGAAGAALAERSGTTLVRGHRVRLVNPAGAGDCLLAGVAHGLSASEGLAAAARRGVAMAAASCERFAAAELDPARVEALLAAGAGG